MQLMSMGNVPTFSLIGPLRLLGACILFAITAHACLSATEDPDPNVLAVSNEKSGEVSNKKKPSELTDKEWWSSDKKELPGGTALERTLALAEGSGGDIHYIEHSGRGDRTVLITPLEFIDGETPLIVSLHGYGGNSADHTSYFPLHERVNSEGYALLLPNGTVNAEGNRFWNPTDECCQGGKSGNDDIGYLTDLVAEAQRVRDFGPVYFFGYSNGGFMSHHMACKGVPGLRAVASVAGTSYVADSSCAGAQSVSVLHVHGTDDQVIRFDGDEIESDRKSGGEGAFYASAEEMARRWSQRIGCEWPENTRPYASLDFDEYVDGTETKTYRLDPGCAGAFNIELWVSEGGSHSPGYGAAFIDALIDWLLAQD